MSRRESLSSSPLPDAGCRFASKQRSRNGNKKGGRSRCRGSKNKKYCKTRRKLRGPTPKLGFGPGALRRTQCLRCDRDQHTRCSRLPTCIQRRASPGFNKREQRTPGDRPPLALRADPRLARMRRTSDQARQQDGQEEATATAQLLATTEELANLNLNPKAPQGSMPSFLQLTQLALAATNVLLGAHSRG